MAFASGNGGEIMGGATVVHVTKWTGDVGARLVENTNSNSAGWTNFEHVVGSAEFTAEGPYDLAATPQATFVNGTRVTAKLYLGNSGSFITITNTLIEKMQITNDNSGDIIRFSMTCKGGVVS